MKTAVLSAVIVLGSGRAILPPFRVLISPGDFQRLPSGMICLLSEELTEDCLREAHERGWSVSNGFEVTVVKDNDITDGRPEAFPLPTARTSIPAESDPQERVEDMRLRHTPVGPIGGSARVQSDPRRMPRNFDSDHTPLAPDQGRSDPELRDTQGYDHVELIPLGVPVPFGEPINLSEIPGPLLIGTTSACGLRLTDPLASHCHAEIRRTSGRFVLCDQNSTNGTYVNGERIVRRALIHNDEIMFAPNGPRFVFSRLSPECLIGQA